MTEIETIRHFFERIAQYANDAGKEVASSAVPYSYVAQIGLTVNSALKYIDALPNKHPETEVCPICNKAHKSHHGSIAVIETPVLKAIMEGRAPRIEKATGAHATQNRKHKTLGIEITRTEPSPKNTKHDPNCYCGKCYVEFHNRSKT